MKKGLHFGHIDRKIFEKINAKLKVEKRKLENDLRGKNKLSNPERFIDFSLKISTNLSDLWVFGDYDQKILLQEIVFPEGIFFDKESNSYRTDRINCIMQLTSGFSSNCSKKK